jgi:hypothetical protein
MKRCPTCGSTYTNDGLVFCLEDGATLRSMSDAQPGFDPEATLRLSTAENAPPPPADFRPQGAPTHRQSAPPLTTAARTPPRTSDHPERPPAASASPTKSTSPVVVAGISAIVVLLLVIAGIGIALLVRNSGGGATVANDNRPVNRESSGNASSTVNDNGSVKTGNTTNRANTNNGNRAGSASGDAVGRAESKVVRGARLEESDLDSLTREELRRLRNAVYARHGRTFDSQDLQRYFEGRSWYKPRSDYNEASLTETDRSNIKLIQTIESRRT